MTDIPAAGFFCAGKTPLALSVSVHCAYKMMDILKSNGFGVGACHTEITEPFYPQILQRAQGTLTHICKCCDLVITVGCDGFSVSDIMPDITEKVCGKSASYFSSVLCGSKEMFVQENRNPLRIYSSDNCGFQMFPSRATAGIFERTLVLNFPGNVYTCTRLLNALMPAVGFTVYNLSEKSARNSAEFKNFLNSSLDFHEVFKKECIVN